MCPRELFSFLVLMGRGNTLVQWNRPEALMVAALDQKLIFFFERIYLMVQKLGPNLLCTFSFGVTINNRLN